MIKDFFKKRDDALDVFKERLYAMDWDDLMDLKEQIEDNIEKYQQKLDSCWGGPGSTFMLRAINVNEDQLTLVYKEMEDRLKD